MRSGGTETILKTHSGKPQKRPILRRLGRNRPATRKRVRRAPEACSGYVALLRRKPARSFKEQQGLPNHSHVMHAQDFNPSPRSPQGGADRAGGAVHL